MKPFPIRTLGPCNLIQTAPTGKGIPLDLVNLNPSQRIANTHCVLVSETLMQHACEFAMFLLPMRGILFFVKKPQLLDVPR